MSDPATLTRHSTPSVPDIGSIHGHSEAARTIGPVKSLLETTKPGITKLVTITSMVGFVMATAGQAGSDLRRLVFIGLACTVGTALSAAGANAINQYIERERDARMPRTLRRPLPTRRVSPAAVLTAGLLLCIAGCGVLWAWCGSVPALLSLACIVSYIAAYTPMKTASSLSTFVGAIPGALPPLIGWTTASETPGWAAAAEWGGLSLFILMFVWQIPHFLAIAWMYKDDYAKGGYVVLPVIDPGGAWTAMSIGLWSAALLPATLLPALVMPDRLGLPYLAFASLSGLAFLYFAARLIRSRERKDARALFFGSIMHLPLLLVVMVAEALARGIF
ncbi:MAG: protoheme IX farnesyltransferase [Phycisphaerae bacterium]|nr:protoheme IX farnesyltransferase [Phycisphaerae bacterium]